MVADIEIAFLNVEVYQSDGDVLRFLWVKDEYCVSDFRRLLALNYAAAAVR